MRRIGNDNGKTTLFASRCASKRGRGLLSLVLLLSPSTSAQKTDSAGSPNAAPGTPAGSYSLSGFESVNLFNGNLNFSLPLLQIGGRGGTVFPVSLTINNNHWKIKRDGVTSGRTGSDGRVYNSDSPHFSDATVAVVTGMSVELDILSCTTSDGIRTCDLLQEYNSSGTTLVLDGSMISDVPAPTGDSIIFHNPDPNGWHRAETGYGPGVLEGRTAVRFNGRPATPNVTLARMIFTAPDGSEVTLVDQINYGRPAQRNAPLARGRVFASTDDRVLSRERITFTAARTHFKRGSTPLGRRGGNSRSRR